MLLPYGRSKVGFPIRRSLDQSSFAAPQGLSQRTTSFIASQRQGIHQMLLRHLIALVIHAPPMSDSRISGCRSQTCAVTKRPVMRTLSGAHHRMLAEHDRWRRSSRCPTGTHSLFTMSDWFLQTHRAEASQRIAKLEFRTGCSTPLPAPTRQRVENGGDRRDRTDDLMLAKHALSQLSYVPEGEALLAGGGACTRSWWAWDDSNVRPHPYQGCALTT